MARALSNDPRPIRAGRRADFPIVRERRPLPGRFHPAPARVVREALRRFGEAFYYGLRLVELAPSPRSEGRIVFGGLIGEGEIRLYDQQSPPWRLGGHVDPRDRVMLEAVGAHVGADGVVDWEAGALRRFMVGHVLAHELGHHVLQHERRLRGEVAARTRDHEGRAEAIAAQLRALLR